MSATLYLIAHIGHTTPDSEHIVWWMPDSKGYTICIDKAGRYSPAEAASICKYGGCIAVRLDDVEIHARSTPYYRRFDGTLDKFYDGGPHRPVPNSRDCWHALLVDQAYPEKSARVSRSTPITARKARSIYLPAGVTIEGGAA